MRPINKLIITFCIVLTPTLLMATDILVNWEHGGKTVNGNAVEGQLSYTVLLRESSGVDHLLFPAGNKLNFLIKNVASGKYFVAVRAEDQRKLLSDESAEVFVEVKGIASPSPTPTLAKPSGSPSPRPSVSPSKPNPSASVSPTKANPNPSTNSTEPKPDPSEEPSKAIPQPSTTPATPNNEDENDVLVVHIPNNVIDNDRSELLTYRRNKSLSNIIDHSLDNGGSEILAKVPMQLFSTLHLDGDNISDIAWLRSSGVGSRTRKFGPKQSWQIMLSSSEDLLELAVQPKHVRNARAVPGHICDFQNDGVYELPWLVRKRLYFTDISGNRRRLRVPVKDPIIQLACFENKIGVLTSAKKVLKNQKRRSQYQEFALTAAGGVSSQGVPMLLPNNVIGPIFVETSGIPGAILYTKSGRLYLLQNDTIKQVDLSHPINDLTAGVYQSSGWSAVVSRGRSVIIYNLSQLFDDVVASDVEADNAIQELEFNKKRRERFVQP